MAIANSEDSAPQASFWCATTSITIHVVVLFMVFTGSRQYFVASQAPKTATSLRIQMQAPSKNVAKVQPVSKPRPKPKKRRKPKALTKTEQIKKETTPQKMAQEPAQQLQPQQAFDLYIKNYIEPHYPRLAIRRGITGRVVLSLAVGQDGKVKDISIRESSGHSILDESAIKAAKQWEFKPLSAQISMEKKIVFTM